MGRRDKPGEDEVDNRFRTVRNRLLARVLAWAALLRKDKLTTHPEKRMSEDERAIRDLIANWIAATKAGDLQTVAALISDDVVFMVPGKAFGKAEFMEASRGMKGMDFEGDSEVLEIEILGTRAWCRTRLMVTVTPPGGKPVKRSGYTLSILRKNADGKWVLARDANLLA
ncbi:MAG TPA: SgcJ/EcaC family oxidoreductase [Micropepsaceae bacterium]|jgi:uncharacterized protein (TIGR02246 family)|nr:SgcJ/EcaC family oxidoreductase [Micropepsaceae bacterium]